MAGSSRNLVLLKLQPSVSAALPFFGGKFPVVVAIQIAEISAARLFGSQQPKRAFALRAGQRRPDHRRPLFSLRVGQHGQQTIIGGRFNPLGFLYGLSEIQRAVAKLITDLQ